MNMKICNRPFTHHAIALANETETPTVLVLGNEAGIGEDGWCLIAPYGNWPKTRRYRENGQAKSQDYIQVLDNASADAMVSAFNSVAGKVKRWIWSVPVLKGHGDLNEVDQAALPNNTPKEKLGVVDELRKSDRGLEAHFALDNDGQAAIQAGCKFPSAFWLVKPLGNENGAIRCQPFQIISVALTAHPNIRGVESLANSQPQPPQPAPNMLIPRLTGLLIGNDCPVPENPTENQIVAAIANAMNDEAADSDTPDENRLSAQAARKTAVAHMRDDKDSHQAAAMAHARAEGAQRQAGEKDDADMHSNMMTYHTKCAANCAK